MILITGATGQLGGATIRFLLDKGFPAEKIGALVRDEVKAAELKDNGINLRIGDYNNVESLVQAFTGIDKLLLISSSDLNARTNQHINAVKAARTAGVGHIFYTSFQRKSESDSPIQFISESHLAAEKEILASGLTYTILQNGLYADILPWFMGEKVLEKGINLPAGNGKAAFTVRLDLAEAAVNLLLSEGHQNRVYSMATNETCSFKDVADILSSLSGKQVSYTDVTSDTFREGMTRAGVPEMMIGMISGFSQAIAQGEFDFSNNDLEKILGRKPVSLSSFLSEVYKLSE